MDWRFTVRPAWGWRRFLAPTSPFDHRIDRGRPSEKRSAIQVRTSIERVSRPAPTGDEGLTASAAMAHLAFEDVYKTCFAFVFRNAKRLGVGDDSIDDVVQEVFLVVHRRLHDYDGRVPINGWIFGILSHVVRGHRRTLRRKHRPMMQGGIDAEAAGDVT